jgi:hypothetical protein
MVSRFEQKISLQHKNILEFLPVYVNDTGDEEPEEVVDLKCGGEVSKCENESTRAHGREREREGGNGGREGGK